MIIRKLFQVLLLIWSTGQWMYLKYFIFIKSIQKFKYPIKNVKLLFGFKYTVQNKYSNYFACVRSTISDLGFRNHLILSRYKRR